MELEAALQRAENGLKAFTRARGQNLTGYHGSVNPPFKRPDPNRVKSGLGSWGTKYPCPAFFLSSNPETAEFFRDPDCGFLGIFQAKVKESLIAPAGYPGCLKTAISDAVFLTLGRGTKTEAIIFPEVRDGPFISTITAILDFSLTHCVQVVHQPGQPH